MLATLLKHTHTHTRIYMYLMKWILELPDVLLDKMFLGDILCFLLHEYFQLWVSLQHILIGLIISSSVVFGRLGVYNPSFLEMVGLGVSGLFDWVSKVLKCQQFTIKKCWDGGVPFFFSLGAICYFTYSWVVYGFLLDLSDQRQEKLTWVSVHPLGFQLILTLPHFTFVFPSQTTALQT